MSTTNRVKRKLAKRKARERAKKNGTNSLRSKQYATGGAIGDWIPDALNPPAPEDGMRLRLTVQDQEGLSCDTAKWPLRMLCNMDASVWVVHDKGGSIHLTDRGRWVQGAALLWARFHAGTDITLTATGPDADEALEGVREMLSIPTGERKALYRSRYLKHKRQATDERKTA